MSFNMRSRIKIPDKSEIPQRQFDPSSGDTKILEDQLAALPERFFNEKGEFDLSGVTGEEAYKVLAGMGLHMGIIPRG